MLGKLGAKGCDLSYVNRSLGCYMENSLWKAGEEDEIAMETVAIISPRNG